MRISHSVNPVQNEPVRSVTTRPFFGPGSKSCHATPSGTALAGLAFSLTAGTTPDLESTMKVHTFTVATAAAAVLAASTMATFAQTGSGTGFGSGSGTRSTPTAPLITAQGGGGRGGGGADGEIQCRTVVVPGSGQGPQQVCE